MRMQIHIPVFLLEQLDTLAREEHRNTRQQAEFYLCRAINEAISQRVSIQKHTETVLAGEGHDAPAP